ncbi:hypothetical protein ACFL2R_02825 [Patescibacteria group bacterium]
MSLNDLVEERYRNLEISFYVGWVGCFFVNVIILCNFFGNEIVYKSMLDPVLLVCSGVTFVFFTRDRGNYRPRITSMNNSVDGKRLTRAAEKSSELVQKLGLGDNASVRLGSVHDFACIDGGTVHIFLEDFGKNDARMFRSIFPLINNGLIRLNQLVNNTAGLIAYFVLVLVYCSLSVEQGWNIGVTSFVCQIAVFALLLFIARPVKSIKGVVDLVHVHLLGITSLKVFVFDLERERKILPREASLRIREAEKAQEEIGK